jgi:hypothetical protein
MGDVETLHVLHRTFETEGLAKATGEVLSLGSRGAETEIERRPSVVARQ